jgi:hypothetical protein
MTATQLSAQDFFRAAYTNRYTWDSDFPGYTADVTYKQGDQVFTGKLRVNKDLSAEVTEVADEDVKKAIHGQAWEVAIHRVRRSFEQTHGNNTFTYGETDAEGAVEILLGGKSQGDRYKVHDNIVSLVHRHMHGVVITINTFSTQDTGEGYLAHRYDSVYHDPKTGEQKGGKNQLEDEHKKVGNYWILSRRVISSDDATQPTQEFVFSNIQLLS